MANSALTVANTNFNDIKASLKTYLQSQSIFKEYEKNTEFAIKHSVFGSPTYFVDGDMFYGQDNLPLVERALERAFK